MYRTLSYKKLLENTAAKINIKNNIVRKLCDTTWGATASTLKTSSQSLVYSDAEYCALVWLNSYHIKMIDTKLNVTMRIITGWLKSTPMPSAGRQAFLKSIIKYWQTLYFQFMMTYRLLVWKDWSLDHPAWYWLSIFTGRISVPIINGESYDIHRIQPQLFTTSTYKTHTKNGATLRSTESTK